MHHGASYWTRTAEISSRAEDGSPKSYLLNVPNELDKEARVTSGMHLSR